MRNEAIDRLRYQGWGYKKISKELGMSPNTVKSYCRRYPFDKNQKVCLQCGKPITNTPQKKEKKFCSDSCRLGWWKMHNELIKKKAFYTFTCPNCGCVFESYGNNHRKYCSRKCHAEARRKVVVVNG